MRGGGGRGPIVELVQVQDGKRPGGGRLRFCTARVSPTWKKPRRDCGRKVVRWEGGSPAMDEGHRERGGQT